MTAKNRSGNTCTTDDENNDSHHSSSPASSPAKRNPSPNDDVDNKDQAKNNDIDVNTTTMPTMPRSRSRVGLDAMVAERRIQGHLVSNVVHIESRESSSRSIQDIYDGVDDGKVLGEGVAGVVRTVVHRVTGLPYAVKVLNLDRLLTRRRLNDAATGGDDEGDGDVDGDDARDNNTFLAQQQEALRNEIIIMSQLDHPNIARLQEVYEDDDNIYLVQEVCVGGELFDLLEEQPDYYLEESEALRLTWQILSSLRYLHSKGIVHRDLKLENFLFSTGKHLQLKMIGAFPCPRLFHFVRTRASYTFPLAHPAPFCLLRSSIGRLWTQQTLSAPWRNSTRYGRYSLYSCT